MRIYILYLLSPCSPGHVSGLRIIPEDLVAKMHALFWAMGGRAFLVGENKCVNTLVCIFSIVLSLKLAIFSLFCAAEQ